MALSHLLDTTPPSLLTTAARGGLRPAPDCRPRRALLHLSYSSAPLHADGAFVTHDPKRSNGCVFFVDAPKSWTAALVLGSSPRTVVALVTRLSRFNAPY